MVGVCISERAILNSNTVMFVRENSQSTLDRYITSDSCSRIGFVIKIDDEMSYGIQQRQRQGKLAIAERMVSNNENRNPWTKEKRTEERRQKKRGQAKPAQEKVKSVTTTRKISGTSPAVNIIITINTNTVNFNSRRRGYPTAWAQ